MQPMTDPSSETAEIARRAAARLADLDPDLPAATDRVAGVSGLPRRRGLDANLALTLASFLVGLAQFGWSVYQDHRGRKEETKEVLVRRLRMRIEQSGAEDLLPPGGSDRVVEVVVEEILTLGGGTR
jgi:hypothetical protein